MPGVDPGLIEDAAFFQLEEVRISKRTPMHAEYPICPVVDDELLSFDVVHAHAPSLGPFLLGTPAIVLHFAS
jgi:hypothetical protein